MTSFSYEYLLEFIFFLGDILQHLNILTTEPFTQKDSCRLTRCQTIELVTHQAGTLSLSKIDSKFQIPDPNSTLLFFHCIEV